MGKIVNVAGEKPVAFFQFSTENNILSGLFMGYGALESKPKEQLIKFKEEKTGIIYWLNSSKAIVDALNYVVQPEVKKTKDDEGTPEIKLSDTDYLIHIVFIGKINIKGGRTFKQFSVTFEMP